MMVPRSPRPSGVRLQVEDGLVTIEVRGVLDAHTGAIAREHLRSVCGLAKTVALDLRGVCDLWTEAHVQDFVDDVRSHCSFVRCRLEVIAAESPRVGYRIEQLEG